MPEEDHAAHAASLPSQDGSEEMNVCCKDVKPGKGRTFLCLQSNLAKVDFSQACKLRVEEKQSRQQNYYMLDFSVRSACKSTVDRLCFSSVKVRSAKFSNEKLTQDS